MKLFLSLSILLCINFNINAQRKKTPTKTNPKVLNVKVETQNSLGKEIVPTFYRKEKVTKTTKGYLKTITCLEINRSRQIICIEKEDHPNSIEEENILIKARKGVAYSKIPATCDVIKITKKSIDTYILKNSDGSIVENVRKKYAHYLNDKGIEESSYLEDLSDNSRWEQCNACGNTVYTN